MSKRRRVLVVGGGIAGVAAAAPLAASCDVTLVDMEATLAFHTTGRSAALLFDTYGEPPLWALTAASRRFFEHPPAGFVEVPLLARRGAMTVGTDIQTLDLDSHYEEVAASGVVVERLDSDDALDLCGVLSPVVTGAVYEPDAADMDVAAIHQCFVKMLRAHDGVIVTSTGLTSASWSGSRWTCTFSDGSERSFDAIVNAAGAWGDVVAARCSIAPVGLQPMRRTAFMVGGPPGCEPWPLTVGIDHTFYFKPDGTQLLCSPADETPEDPCDARAREIDVAMAIDRINDMTTLGIRHVNSAWAGQRTFARDRVMVIGPEQANDGFVWLVGQGGTGIQTAPAAGALAAWHILGGAMPEPLAAAGVDAAAFLPDRFR